MISSVDRKYQSGKKITSVEWWIVFIADDVIYYIVD